MHEVWRGHRASVVVGGHLGTPAVDRCAGDVVRLWIGNFPYRANDNELLAICEPLGDVIEMQFPTWKDSGRRRGFVTATLRLRDGLSPEAARALLDRKPVPVPGKVGAFRLLTARIGIESLKSGDEP